MIKTQFSFKVRLLKRVGKIQVRRHADWSSLYKLYVMKIHHRTIVSM